MVVNSGSTVTFQWSGYHNVVEVSNNENFETCNAAGGVEHAPSAPGGEFSVVLNTPGTHYYICSVPSHCVDGQRIAITVQSANAATLPSPPPLPPPLPPPPSQSPGVAQTFVLPWAIPMEPQAMVVNSGSTVTFQWSGVDHNVVEVSNNENFEMCNAAGGVEHAPPAPGGEYSVVLNTPGTHYYICSVPSHCVDGQKIAITVQSANAATLPSPPPPSPSPPPPSPSPSSSEFVLLTVTVRGSVSDYPDTSILQQIIATAAGVEASAVIISVAAASVIITATIEVPTTTTAATVQARLSTSLAIATAAEDVLGIPVEAVPVVLIANPPSQPPLPPPSQPLPSEPSAASLSPPTPPSSQDVLDSSSDVTAISAIAGGVAALAVVLVLVFGFIGCRIRRRTRDRARGSNVQVQVQVPKGQLSANI